jgi:LysM repeat protein
MLNYMPAVIIVPVTNLFSHLCSEKFIRMKRLLILFFCIPLLLNAQNNPLIIDGVSPHFYIKHTVQAKENYYSIGRIYSISPKEIAPFNNLQLEKGLSLHQVIKIPLLEVNFTQTGSADANDVLVPVYHAVNNKEGLYRVGVNYNNLPVATLKLWNGIKGDAVPGGTKLIVGYLKVNPSLSTLSSMAKKMPGGANAQQAQAVVKKEPTVEIKEAVKIKEDVENGTVEGTVKAKETIVVKEQPPVTVKKDALPVTVEKEAESVNQPVATSATVKSFNGGYFINTYGKQEKKGGVKYETGVAAIFKSNSGWEDGKYYCLHNSATPGTIIKVTSTTTGKSIYAKVLDVIPDIKQNSGLLIRISNAAAQELGEGEIKFDCSLTYSK